MRSFLLNGFGLERLHRDAVSEPQPGSGEVKMRAWSKGVRVNGFFVSIRAMFEAMNRAIELNGLKPVIDRVFDFANFASRLPLSPSAVSTSCVTLTVAGARSLEIEVTS
jgi:hypothetical protein